MKVLFTHGYFLHEDLKEQKIMKPYPPLGILYLSAWLEKNGLANEVFDTTFSTKPDLKNYLLENRPKLVGIYTNLMTKLNVLEIVKFVRVELENSWVVIGGPDVTHNLEGYLGSGADFAVIGEGEQTMLEISLAAENLNRSADENFFLKNFGHISGLAFQLSDGSVHKNSSREKMKSLDDLPQPNRAKIHLQKYLDAWKKAHGQNAVSVSTQRGCPYTCKWCSTAVYGQSYRRRDPAAVVDEIENLQKNYVFDLIWFVDDVFTVSHRWVREFHDELKKRGVKIDFECITRADRLNLEVLEILKSAGCFRVWIGAESGSQKIIDAMDRRVDVGQVREMIRAARRAEIQAGTFIMLGYPGETEADIFETVEHLKLSNPDLFTITIAYPIKGTGLYQEVENQLIESENWENRTDRDLDFPRTFSKKYYDFAVRWTVNSVHFHKQKLLGKQFSRNGLKFLAKSWAARAGMIFSKMT